MWLERLSEVLPEIAAIGASVLAVILSIGNRRRVGRTAMLQASALKWEEIIQLGKEIEFWSADIVGHAYWKSSSDAREGVERFEAKEGTAEQFQRYRRFTTLLTIYGFSMFFHKHNDLWVPQAQSCRSVGSV